MGRLDGRVALITGAARGQGAAAARRYVAEGARVVIADVLDTEGETLAKELGESACFAHLDVSSEEQWDSAVQLARDRYGTFDVLVNNAGVVHIAPLADTTLDDYERVTRVNQRGAFLGMRAAARAMSDGGAIVNISSIEGLSGMPCVIAYTASKFAVRGMTKAAAVELGHRGIRVNSVHPGVIDTAMVRDLAGADTDLSPLAGKIALQRVGQPEEIAELVVFLGSAESSYCTGAEFVADGGATATHSLG